MALVKCKSCEHKMSTKAKACPSCGEPKKKKTSVLTWLVLILLALLIYAASESPQYTTSSKPIQLTEEQKHEIEIEAKRRVQASFENSTILQAKKAVKNTLKDPISAEFGNIFFNETDEVGAVACGTVNSKNSFGAYSGFQPFISNGKTVFLQEKDSNFSSVWQAACNK